MADQQKLHVAIIVQARLGSTRLHGKVMMDVLGRPLLSFLVERLEHCKNAQTFLIATTANPLDHSIVIFCEDQHIPFFIGSEENVLDRYYQAALGCSADIIVRITADCPLIDPAIVDRVIDTFLSHYPRYDYVSNVVRRTYPRGMDVEVFSFPTLQKMHRFALKPSEREHVTSYIFNHPEQFSIGSVTAEQDHSRYRLTVDTEEDFRLIQLILQTLYPYKPAFTLEDILALFQQHPEWVQINAHVEQKPIERGDDVAS